VPQKPLVILKDEGKLVHYSFASKKMDHQVSLQKMALATRSGWLTELSMVSSAATAERLSWRRAICSPRKWE
jgi:hypothetical protein